MVGANQAQQAAPPGLCRGCGDARAVYCEDCVDDIVDRSAGDETLYRDAVSAAVELVAVLRRFEGSVPGLAALLDGPALFALRTLEAHARELDLRKALDEACL